MPGQLERLLNIASDAIMPALGTTETRSALGYLIDYILSERNGFYAFESALLVRPLSSQSLPVGVVEWNDAAGWKKRFQTDLSAEMFFAEDVFGEQFSLREEGIFKFNPETGAVEYFAKTLEDWAETVCEGFGMHTGHPLAHEWQRQHGALKNGQRLAPKIPFVAGGEYCVANLVPMDDIELMVYRAQIANQIANLPDGADIKIEVSAL